jgi:nitroimidazol reductase NimA-like FMN-containing flavoprotein (pyridoxamine 5'-phosphate oxidase superfamily)
MDELTREESLRLLAEAPVAHLGVISDGRAYVTPMSFVLDGERILFRTMPGRKFRAIEESPDVCVEVSTFDATSGSWASVIVNGTAREVTDAPTGELAVQRLLNKYSESIGSPMGRSGLQPLAGLPHVVEVTIGEVTGMSSGRGLSPRTRPGRL